MKKQGWENIVREQTCDELEGTGGDFLARAGYAKDNTLTPALVTALQGAAHHLCVGRSSAAA